MSAQLSLFEIEIVGARLFRFINTDTGGAFLQITAVRLRGEIGFVREMRRGRPGESFHISSNARLGHKVDGNRFGREVLELAAPRPVWRAMAAGIAELDALGREVLRSNRWGMEYARQCYERAPEPQDPMMIASSRINPYTGETVE